MAGGAFDNRMLSDEGVKRVFGPFTTWEEGDPLRI